MPISFERYLSRSSTDGDNPTGTLLYWVDGTDDGLIAKSIVRSALPQYFHAADAAGNPKLLVLQDLDAEPKHNDFWYVEANYGLMAKAESSWQFDTSGGTQHITQSLATVGAYGDNAAVNDFQGVIGVTGGGKNVEGCDIVIPKFEWSERHHMPLVTQPYSLMLGDLTGSFNTAAWRGFPRGEILYLGARGSKVGEEDWELEFFFARSPNKHGFQVGDIVVVEKLGWDYMWVLRKEQENANIHEITPHPKAVYVERVLEEADLSMLGIDYTF